MELFFLCEDALTVRSNQVTASQCPHSIHDVMSTVVTSEAVDRIFSAGLSKHTDLPLGFAENSAVQSEQH